MAELSVNIHAEKSIGDLGMELINANRLVVMSHDARLRVLAYKLLTVKALSYEMLYGAP